jgi:hypothetical protein
MSIKDKHSKYYWDTDRNQDLKHTTPIQKVMMSAPEGIEFNKSYTIDMADENKTITGALSPCGSERAGSDYDIDYKKNPIPNYYVGKTYGYEARKVCEDFELSYNVGTAITYLLRAGKKREMGLMDLKKHKEDIQKAINHLNFEMDRLNNKKK